MGGEGLHAGGGGRVYEQQPGTSSRVLRTDPGTFVFLLGFGLGVCFVRSCGFIMICYIMFVQHVLFFLMSAKQMTRAAGVEIDLGCVCCCR